MKYRKDVGDIIRNVKLISDNELVDLLLVVNDEVKRRFEDVSKFRNKNSFSALKEDLRKVMR